MTILSLWLPILVSAGAVFFVSAMVWMVLPWHKNDFAKTTDEDAVRAALKGCAPGSYSIPNICDAKDFKDPIVQQKYAEGPVAFVTVVPSGPPTMGGKLIKIFIYYILIGVLCAYLVSRTLPADASYLSVFRIAGTTAFIAHGVAYVQDNIWFGRPWSSTAKSFLDALIYALLTAGVFGWLA